MGKISYKSRIFKPLSLDGGRNIFIGKRVIIQKYTWLAAVKCTNVEQCRLEIGDGSHIGNFNHIYCTQRITIKKNVLTADKVYISDNLHSYEDINTPIWQQSIRQLNPVVIGENAWLGENVCVIGASVGRGSVIGANSVVTRDIPDYCVAVGAPAKIVKRYCFEQKKWRKIDKIGCFID